MEFVRAMAGLFHRAGANRIALESVFRRVENEAARLLLDKDKVLQEKLRQAKEKSRGGDLKEPDLLLQARQLHEALAEAKGKAAGG